MKLSLIALTLVFSFGLCLRGQGRETKSQDLSYENHNQIDYGPLEISGIKGITMDVQDVAVPEALVILFSEKGHRLLQHTTTDRDGRFMMTRVPAGRYRLVVKYDGFCSVNVPLRVRKRRESKREIIVRMKPAEIDGCSYGESEAEAHLVCLPAAGRPAYRRQATGFCRSVTLRTHSTKSVPRLPTRAGS